MLEDMVEMVPEKSGNLLGGHRDHCSNRKGDAISPLKSTFGEAGGGGRDRWRRGREERDDVSTKVEE